MNDANQAAASLATLNATPAAVVQSPDRYAMFLAFRRAHEDASYPVIE